MQRQLSNYISQTFGCSSTKVYIQLANVSDANQQSLFSGAVIKMNYVQLFQLGEADERFLQYFREIVSGQVAETKIG